MRVFKDQAVRKPVDVRKVCASHLAVGKGNIPEGSLEAGQREIARPELALLKIGIPDDQL